MYNVNPSRPIKKVTILALFWVVIASYLVSYASPSTCHVANLIVLTLYVAASISWSMSTNICQAPLISSAVVALYHQISVKHFVNPDRDVRNHPTVLLLDLIWKSIRKLNTNSALQEPNLFVGSTTAMYSPRWKHLLDTGISVVSISIGIIMFIIVYLYASSRQTRK
jgi:hypothetical protein